MLPGLRRRYGWPTLMDEFFNESSLPGLFNREGTENVPAVNITEGKDAFTIEVAAPGLAKSDFKINLDNNVLTISSEKETREESKEENVLRREFGYSAFTRSFTLPETVNGEKIKATHENGILSIVVPKKEEAVVKPAREIKIS